MHATRAAVEEGILPGGGVALLRATDALKKVRTQNDDQKVGIEIVRKAIQAPARQIAFNAGEDGSVIVGKILEKDEYNYGFDAQAGEYGDLVKKGVIDPTKVVRSAIQGAASVAGLLITTEAMVAELPQKKGQAMPGGRYPIKDCRDVTKAVHAVGRGKGDPSKIRGHIKSRAKSLGCMDQIPDDWK